MPTTHLLTHHFLHSTRRDWCILSVYPIARGAATDIAGEIPAGDHYHRITGVGADIAIGHRISINNANHAQRTFIVLAIQYKKLGHREYPIPYFDIIGMQICPYDSDGDGNCHLCQRSHGGCLHLPA